MPKITYLAVMPRHRKPLAVPPSHVAFYRERAARFYEAPPGVTAAEARRRIASGELRSTYERGQLVGADPDARVLPSIDALSRKAWAWLDSGMPGYAKHARLWLADRFATPQTCSHGLHHGVPPAGRAWHWHMAGGAERYGAQTDVLYDPEPVTVGDLERAFGARVSLDLLVEDHERGVRTSDVGRPWRVVESWDLDGPLGRVHLQMARRVTMGALRERCEHAERDLSLVLSALQCVVHEQPDARETWSEPGGGTYEAVLYRAPSPCGGVLLVTYRRPGQSPYTSASYFEAWESAVRDAVRRGPAGDLTRLEYAAAVRLREARDRAAEVAA